MHIFIWGTGRMLGNFLGKHIAEDKVEGFIDSNKKEEKYLGKRIYTPDEILSVYFDAIIVVTTYAAEIRQQCIDIGIDLSKVIFIFNNYEITDINTNYKLADTILGKDYVQKIKTRYHVIRSMEENIDNIYSDYDDSDYVRIRTFSLIAKEIKQRKLSGEVAELGVFRGDFAKYINREFKGKNVISLIHLKVLERKKLRKSRQKGTADRHLLMYIKIQQLIWY